MTSSEGAIWPAGLRPVGAPSETSPRRGCGGKAAARTLSLACVASEAACYSDGLLELQLQEGVRFLAAEASAPGGVQAVTVAVAEHEPGLLRQHDGEVHPDPPQAVARELVAGNRRDTFSSQKRRAKTSSR